MKLRLISLLAIFFILTNCSLDTESDTPPQQQFRSVWNLINVSGGIAGVNQDFDLETIIWAYDDTTALLTVENNNNDTSIHDGLASGIYTFSINSVGNNNYMIIDGDEIGEYYFNSQNIMIIDQNNTSDGVLDDGFVYTFQRTLIAL